jgi:hypothetical protein
VKIVCRWCCVGWEIAGKQKAISFNFLLTYWIFIKQSKGFPYDISPHA